MKRVTLAHPHPISAPKSGGCGISEKLSPNKSFTFSNIFSSLSSPQPPSTSTTTSTPAFVTVSTPVSCPQPDLLASPCTPLSLAARRRRRRKELRIQSFTASHDTKHHNARRLLKFIGAVNSHPTRILIDGGAEGNVISSEFCRSHNVSLTPSAPIPIVLPNGSASLSHHQAHFNLARFNYMEQLDAIVYPLSKYDLILGKPWLTAINPNIDWQTNKLTFTFNGAQVTWPCDGFDKPLESTMISAINLMSLATNADNCVFLSQIKIPKPAPIAGPEVPDDIRPIIEIEFPELFPTELPDGLPPDRGDSMHIVTDPMADPPVCPVI